MQLCQNARPPRFWRCTCRSQARIAPPDFGDGPRTQTGPAALRADVRIKETAERGALFGRNTTKGDIGRGLHGCCLATQVGCHVADSDAAGNIDQLPAMTHEPPSLLAPPLPVPHTALQVDSELPLH